MANFVPLKNYIFLCLDKAIENHNLKPPFLDAGCGIGDLSAYVAKKGWDGVAVDTSLQAIAEAKNALREFPNVKVLQESVMNTTGSFNTILLWDVIEHIKEDQEFLHKIESLLLPGGQLLIATPSNPREWGWDDEFYGHYRRYTAEEITLKLKKSGLETIFIWDITFPVFWIMRRAYVLIKKPPKSLQSDTLKETRTEESSMINAWDIPIISRILNKENFVWKLIYKIQFNFFRKKVSHGHEILVLARKKQ